MMKKLLSSLLIALTFANSFLAMPAYAQVWDGPGQQPITITSAHTLGDGSTAQGGIAPALENGSAPVEPADIPSNFTLADWLGPGLGSRTEGQPEAKARFHCHFSHELQEDPILFAGQAKKGHLHSFFGNTGANRNSNYTSLRTTGHSTCAGGPINRTAYWYPSVRKQLSSGLYVTLKPERIIVYYLVATVDAALSTRLPRNLRYVSGYNPADPNYTPLLTALNAANAAIGSSGRYTFYGSTAPPSQTNIFDGFKGWRCDNSTYPATAGKTVPYLKNAAGQDMFVVEHGAPCGAGRISFVVDAPRCWDGKNLSSPDGREHVSQLIKDNTLGTVHCPNGWFKLPAFEGSFIFTSGGPTDYLQWFFSSDRMNPTTTPPDGSHRSECRRVSYKFCNGETGHFDWWGAWDYGTEASPGVMLTWMRRCNGTKTYPSATGEPADCVDNSFDGGVGKSLLGNAETVPAACIADPTCPKQGPSNYQIWLSKPGYSTWIPVKERYATPTPGANGTLNAVGGHGHTSENDNNPFEVIGDEPLAVGMN